MKEVMWSWSMVERRRSSRHRGLSRALSLGILTLPTNFFMSLRAIDGFSTINKLWILRTRVYLPPFSVQRPVAPARLLRSDCSRKRIMGTWSLSTSSSITSTRKSTSPLIPLKATTWPTWPASRRSEESYLSCR